MAPTLRLVYFDFPGKPEIIRLTAFVGGLALEDDIIGYGRWGALKAKVAPQQLPLLYVNGQVVAQSDAQLRYVAKLANLYPRDARTALRVDELTDYAWEIFNTLQKVFANNTTGVTPAAAMARGGDMEKWLAFLDSRLAGKKYAVGNTLTSADLALFISVNLLRSGYFSGISAHSLRPYRNLAAHRAVIANHPRVRQYYASANGVRTAFQP